MEALSEFWHRLSHLEELIRWGGYAVLVAIVFAENGLLIGFFLPGDSLLVTAGFLAAQPELSGSLNLGALLLLLCVAAILGQAAGYWIGYKAGPHLFSRPNSRFFKQEYVHRAKSFYEKHGGKTLVLARFMPIVRTFVPVVAGVAQMDFRTFMLYNIWGGIGWVTSMCLLGYGLGRLGQRFAPVKDHIELVVLAVIFLSLLPGVVHLIKERRRSRSDAHHNEPQPREGVTG